MPPTDQLQIATLPMPVGMNTMLPPYALPANRSSFIVNYVPINGELVGRRGWLNIGGTYTTTSRYVLSCVACETYAGGASKLVYNFTSGTTTEYFVSSNYTQGFGSAPANVPAGLTSIITLANNGNKFKIVPYDGDSRQTEVGSGSATNFSEYILASWGVTDGEFYYAPDISSAFTTPPLIWGGNIGNITATANVTFAAGDDNASYTTLSPSSTVLTNCILTDQNNYVYKVISQTVLTSTTGDIVLERVYRGTTGTQTGLSFLSIAPMNNWAGTLVVECMEKFRGRLWGGTIYGKLYFSEPGEFDRLVPQGGSVANFLDISAYPILSLYQFANKLFIFERNRTWTLSGYDTDSFEVDLFSTHIGCQQPTSITDLNGVMYFANHHGMWAYSGGDIQEITGEIRNLWTFMYMGGSDTSANTWEPGARVSTTVIRNRYLLVTIHNVLEQVTPLCYSLLYDTATGTWTMVGASTTSSGTVTSGKYLPEFFNKSGNRLIGASAVGLCDLQDIIPVPPLGQRLSDTSLTGSTEWIVDGHNSGGLGTSAFEMLYEVHTPGYILYPDGTSRIFEMDLEHSTMYPTNSVTTDTAFALKFYRDSNAPSKWVSAQDQFTTAINATAKQLSIDSTNTTNNSLHSRINFYDRVIDSAQTAFDSRSFMVVISSDPAVVGANPVNTVYRLSGLIVRFQPTRQTRVQD